MLASLLALGSGIGWGTSDYLGGRASRRHGTVRVLVISQSTALAVLALTVTVLRPGFPAPGAAVAGVIAGLGEIVGVGALYRGLATGVTAIVAPAASAAPLVPLAVGLALGAIPGPWQLVGVALVLIGVVLTSLERSDAAGAVGPAVRLRSVGWGAIAAAGFGVYLVAMATAADGGVLWALLLARTTGAVLVSVLALVLWASRRAPASRMNPRDLVPVLSIGVIIVAADALYASSAALGVLALVAVLSSTHPAITVLLARFHGGERLAPVRVVGITVTVLGVLAITAL